MNIIIDTISVLWWFLERLHSSAEKFTSPMAVFDELISSPLLTDGFALHMFVNFIHQLIFFDLFTGNVLIITIYNDCDKCCRKPNTVTLFTKSRWEFIFCWILLGLHKLLMVRDRTKRQQWQASRTEWVWVWWLSLYPVVVNRTRSHYLQSLAENLSFVGSCWIFTNCWWSGIGPGDNSGRLVGLNGCECGGSLYTQVRDSYAWLLWEWPEGWLGLLSSE